MRVYLLDRFLEKSGNFDNFEMKAMIERDEKFEFDCLLSGLYSLWPVKTDFE